MTEYTLQPTAPSNEPDLVLKVWRPESMAFILASCASRRIQTVPSGAFVSPDGSYQVTLTCDRRRAEEVRAEFNSRPVQRYGRAR